MKKKNMLMMFLSVFALGLTACNSDNSTPSTSDNSTTPPVDDGISTNALRSIMGSFTANGKMKISYTGGYLPVTEAVYLAMDANALETLDVDGNIQQIFNINDAQSYYYVNVDNTIAVGRYADNYGNAVPYEFELLSAYTTSLRASYFEKNLMGNYTVINQTARQVIASTLAATYYYEDFGTIDSMELVVNNDVVTNVKFKTSPIVIQSNVSATIEFDLEITNHGTTVIESDVKPYETYPQAKALGNAFKALENVTIDLTVTIEDTDEVYYKGTSYMFDDFYYGSLSIFDDDGTYTQSFGYVDYPELDGMMAFNVDENGMFESVNLYNGFSVIDAGLEYGASYVAPEMFEYKNGKYVTRATRDVARLARYLIMDFDGSSDYASELTLTLDGNGNLNTISYDVYFYTDATQTAVELHHYVYKITSNENKETNLDNLNAYKENLTKFADVDSDMLYFWADESRDYIVQLYYGLFKINGELLNITSIDETTITGTINEDEYVVTLTEAKIDEDDEEEVLCVTLKINEDEEIKLFYSNAFFENDIWALGVASFVNPEDMGLKFYAHDTSLLDYNQFLMFFEGDVNSDFIAEYVDSILENTSYVYDISNLSASDILSGGSNLKMTEFISYIFSNEFNFEAVLMNSNYTMIAIGSYEFEGQTYLVIWMLL